MLARVLSGTGADACRERFEPGLDSEFDHPSRPAANGDNTVEVALKRPDGVPEGDASVAADFYMPAMPSMNMPEMHSEVAFAHQGEGIYRGDLHLVMAGTWNVSLRVSREGQVLGSVSYTVIAR